MRRVKSAAEHAQALKSTLDVTQAALGRLRAAGYANAGWSGTGADVDVAGARDVLAAFLQQFGQWLAQGGQVPALDVAGLAPPALRVRIFPDDIHVQRHLDALTAPDEAAWVEERRPFLLY